MQYSQLKEKFAAVRAIGKWIFKIENKFKSSQRSSKSLTSHNNSLEAAKSEPVILVDSGSEAEQLPIQPTEHILLIVAKQLAWKACLLAIFF